MSVNVSVRLDDSLANRLRVRARAAGETLSDQLRRYAEEGARHEPRDRRLRELRLILDEMYSPALAVALGAVGVDASTAVQLPPANQPPALTSPSMAPHPAGGILAEGTGRRGGRREGRSKVRAKGRSVAGRRARSGVARAARGRRVSACVRHTMGRVPPRRRRRMPSTGISTAGMSIRGTHGTSGVEGGGVAANRVKKRLTPLMASPSV